MFYDNPPDKIYAELFEAVQTGDVFEDSKTFVDAIPRADPEFILKSFQENQHKKEFDLGSFVASNFDLPQLATGKFKSDAKRPLRRHIELLWDVLTREADTEHRDSSLISLPKPYVVPGGRFREIYYWDSYFTMLGLAASGRVQLIQDMVDNFAFLIDRIGFIPNGNRSYFCTRSQPPLFALMVELLAKIKQQKSILPSYVTQLEKEYDFWMSGSELLGGDRIAERRVVAVKDGYLNRYWDDSDFPRQESYAEDLELAKACARDPARLFRDIRSACESGWDFSSRWLADERSMASIRTSQILPVDLNAAMYKLESTLARAFRTTHNSGKSRRFEDRAEARKQMLQSMFFNDKEGFFVDLSLPDLQPTGTLSLAAAYPLFFELASPEQASRVRQRIRKEFLRPGGWVTTLNTSGQQWDAPNGWAPLQWIVYVGLNRYGFSAEAEEGARRWVKNNVAVYRSSGRLLEKYDVEKIGLFAAGGEYKVQDGFGWTNGVLLCLLDELDME